MVIDVIKIAQWVGAHPRKLCDTWHAGEQVCDGGRTLVVLSRHKNLKIVPLLLHSGAGIDISGILGS